ncbi:hypothetical protein E2C01_067031 [Portunus trituberculatus]|uniref:Uncharacterized protein n=1 Tax=Portunus trituberculatus TaxID=210409 RepID=A0A5B7HSH9_PORTR|nr:hypothetical protein [Portunus trituberculatus]
MLCYSNNPTHTVQCRSNTTTTDTHTPQPALPSPSQCLPFLHITYCSFVLPHSLVLTLHRATRCLFPPLLAHTTPGITHPVTTTFQSFKKLEEERVSNAENRQ